MDPATHPPVIERHTTKRIALGTLVLTVGLTACGTAGQTAPAPPQTPTSIPSPTPSPALEGVAATLLAASGTLHQGSTSLGDASAALASQLPDSARSNAQDALAQVVGAREQLSGVHSPGPYARAYQLLNQADVQYLAAANNYVRASGGNGSAAQAAGRAASAGDGALQQADAALADRPETRLASVQNRAQNLVGVFPNPQPTARKAISKRRQPRKPVIKRPATKRRPLARAHPAPAPTAPPTPTPTPTPRPKPHPAVKKKARPTPTSTRLPTHHPARASRPHPTATPGISPALLARQRSTLLSILSDVQGAATRLRSIRGRLGVAAAQPDFDPSALAAIKSRIDAAVTDLQAANQRSDAAHPVQPLSGARDQVSSAARAYSAAAGELNRAIRDVEAGNQAAAKSDLSAADSSLAQADLAAGAAQTDLTSVP